MTPCSVGTLVHHQMMYQSVWNATKEAISIISFEGTVNTKMTGNIAVTFST